MSRFVVVLASLVLIATTQGCSRTSAESSPEVSSPSAEAPVNLDDNIPTAQPPNAPGQERAAEAAAEETVAPSAIPAPSDVAAPPKNAERSESGLAWTVLRKGTGDKHPGASDIVTVNYSFWTTSGRMFDSSLKRGRPDNFPLNRVIKGWTEGVQMMVAGEKRRFWIPGSLAFDKLIEDHPETDSSVPQGTVVCDVELISFKEVLKPPGASKEVARRAAEKKRRRNAIEIRSVELYRYLQANPDFGLERFQGRLVKLNGPFVGLKTDPNGKPLVMLPGGHEWRVVYVRGVSSAWASKYQYAFGHQVSFYCKRIGARGVHPICYVK